MYQESSDINDRKENFGNINTKNRINNNRNRKIKRETSSSDNSNGIDRKVNVNSSMTLVNNSLENLSINSGLKINQYEIKSNKSSFRKNASTPLNVISEKKEILQNILNFNANITVQKRQNTWWSSTDTTRSRVQPVKTKNRGTPQYRGGCFGTPNKGDIKRAEIFSR